MRPRRVEPGPGQESVWDYPRPPAVEASVHHVTVTIAGVLVAESRRPIRVLETSQPPTYYFPPGDVRTDLLAPGNARSVCEWKGVASYWSAVVEDRRIDDVAWSYPTPTERFAAIRDHFAFYPQRADVCTVDGEVVAPNEGSFYGGWITSNVVGPFKGAPGTLDW